MDISNEIRKALISKGASILGFADLSEIPEQYRKGFRYGISIAVALNSEKVKAISEVPNNEYYNEYQRTNELLDSLNLYTSYLLKERGFEAYSNTRNHVIVDQSTKRSELPHKTVSTRSGIGWIGKCALLVTEKYGAAVRITSVFTNAELNVGKPINESRCGECNKCKDICPAQAVIGKEWKIGMDREEFFHALDCRDKIHERGIKFNYNRTDVTCGLCILECPWTQRYINSKKL